VCGAFGAPVLRSCDTCLLVPPPIHHLSSLKKQNPLGTSSITTARKLQPSIQHGRNPCQTATRDPHEVSMRGIFATLFLPALTRSEQVVQLLYFISITPDADCIYQIRSYPAIRRPCWQGKKALQCLQQHHDSTFLRFFGTQPIERIGGFCGFCGSFLCFFHTGSCERRYKVIIQPMQPMLSMTCTQQS